MQKLYKAGSNNLCLLSSNVNDFTMQNLNVTLYNILFQHPVALKEFTVN
jgi:hypothetical protein